MKSYDPDQLYQVLRDIFGEQYEIRRGQFRIDCINPLCDDDSGNLEISLDRGIFHCWKCEYSGKLRKLLRDYLGKAPNLEEYVSPADLRRSIFEVEEEEEKVPKIFSLPKEYIPFDGRKLGIVGQKAYQYAVSRITKEDIQKHRIGFCGLGDYRWRIIIPVLREGKVIYFVARAFMGNKDLPYRNPDKEECGIGKEEIVFNIEGAIKEGQAVICEGVFDALKVGDDGVAIFGTHISDEQVEQLKVVKKIYVLLDADALDKAVVLAIRLREVKKPLVSLIELPTKKGETPDPDDFTRAELREMIGRAIPFSFDEEIRLTESLRWRKPKDFVGLQKK
jgi:DNA primase